MKALLITVIASFFAITVSAQVATDTKTTGTIATGKKELSTRPAKVASSTTPTFTNAQGTNMSSKKRDANTPAATTTPASNLTEGPASEKDRPATQTLSTGSTTAPAKEVEKPKE